MTKDVKLPAIKEVKEAIVRASLEMKLKGVKPTTIVMSEELLQYLILQVNEATGGESCVFDPSLTIMGLKVVIEGSGEEAEKLKSMGITIGK